MRRVLSWLLLTAATLCGWAAVTTFTVAHTAGDPALPARILSAELASASGRAALADVVAAGLRQVDPAPADAARVQNLAARAAADPRVLAAVRSAASGRTPFPAAVTPAVQQALRPLAPRLAADLWLPLPAAARLPGQSLWVPQAAALAPFATHAALAALVLAVLAAVVGPDVARTLRRLGRRVAGMTALPVLVLWALPVLVLPHLSSAWAGAAGVGLSAAGAGVVAPFAACLAAGVTLTVLGTLLRRRARTGAPTTTYPLLPAGASGPGSVPLPVPLAPPREGP